MEAPPAESGITWSSVAFSKNQFGAAGVDIVLRMPMGTIISDAESGEVIAELLVPGEKVLLAKGGDGGFGNLHFKSSTNRAPRQKTPGWPGEQRKLRLELRVLADVGLLGLPNANRYDRGSKPGQGLATWIWRTRRSYIHPPTRRKPRKPAPV